MKKRKRNSNIFAVIVLVILVIAVISTILFIKFNQKKLILASSSCNNDAYCEPGETKENCPRDCLCNYNWKCESANGETKENCFPDCYFIECEDDTDCPNPSKQDCTYYDYGARRVCRERCKKEDERIYRYCELGEVCFNGECKLPCQDSDAGFNPKMQGIVSWFGNNQVSFFKDKCYEGTNILLENFCGQRYSDSLGHISDYYRDDADFNCEELGRICKEKKYVYNGIEHSVGYCAIPPKIEAVKMDLGFTIGQKGTPGYRDYSYIGYLMDIGVSRYEYFESTDIGDMRFRHQKDQTCEDSDGGKKYYGSGTTLQFDPTGVFLESNEDKCQERILTEYYCENGIAKKEEIECMFGCNFDGNACNPLRAQVITSNAGFSNKRNKGLVCVAKIETDPDFKIEDFSPYLRFKLFSREKISDKFAQIYSSRDFECFYNGENLEHGTKEYSCVFKIKEEQLKRGTQLVCGADLYYSPLTANELPPVFTDKERKNINEYKKFTSQEEMIVAQYNYFVAPVDQTYNGGLKEELEYFYSESEVNDDVWLAGKGIYLDYIEVLKNDNPSTDLGKIRLFLKLLHDLPRKVLEIGITDEIKLHHDAIVAVVVDDDYETIDAIDKITPFGLTFSGLAPNMIFRNVVTVLVAPNMESMLAHEMGHYYASNCDEYELFTWTWQNLLVGCKSPISEDGSARFPKCCDDIHTIICCKYKMFIFEYNHWMHKKDCNTLGGNEITKQSDAIRLCRTKPQLPDPCGFRESCHGMPYKDINGNYPIDNTYSKTNNPAQSWSIMQQGGDSRSVYPENSKCPLRNC